MLKFIIKCFFFIFIFALAACPVVFVFGVIDKHPAVGKSPELSFDQVKRMEQLVRRYKPYSMSVRQSRRVKISQTDLNLMATYGAAQFADHVAVFPRISLSDSVINISATVKIPHTPLGEYINTTCVLASENGRLRVCSIRAGFITLPGKLITIGLSYLGQALLAPDEYQLVLQTLDAVHSVEIRGRQLRFIYDWNPHALSRLHESQKSMLIAPEHQYRLVVYTNALTEICATFKAYGVKRVSMVRVVRPLFNLALEQSRVSGKPVEENRALLQAVSLFCLGRGVEHFVSKELALDVKPSERIALTVWGRDDLVKHFFVSAGIAVSGGTKLSNFAGLAKEVDDSGGGIGNATEDGRGQNRRPVYAPD